MNAISLYANCSSAVSARTVGREGTRGRSTERMGRETQTQTHLLPETDPRAGVEGKEDERVRDEVLLHALVEEPVRIEAQGWQSTDFRRRFDGNTEG